jgi:hypothetical protein
MSFGHLRDERRVASELSRPLEAIDRMVKSGLLLVNSDYQSPVLGYEYEYFKGKPVVGFHLDSCGFATLTQGNRVFRDTLAQSHLALQHFHEHLLSDTDYDREQFLSAGSRLICNLQSVILGGRKAAIGFSLVHKKEYAGNHSPWMSALAQGAIIRVLCRMWQYTNRETYLSTALKAAAPFLVDVKDGGVSTMQRIPGRWYEEYPFPGQCYHVLNGFVTALFSLHELWRVTVDRMVWELWESGIDTLSSTGLLDRFDTGYWTRYDLRPGIPGLTPASLHYHGLHVLQHCCPAKFFGRPITNTESVG